MDPRLPAEIRVEPLAASGVRLVLPDRSLGAVPRAVARLLPLAAIVAFIAPVFEFWHMAGLLVQAPGGFAVVFGAVMLLFLVPGLLAARFLFFAAMCAVYGHSEIEIGEGQLSAVEKYRGWQRRWSRPLADVTHLAVAGGVDNPRLHRWLGDVAAVRAGGAQDGLWLATGYPRSLCEALSTDLHQRLLQAGCASIVIAAPEPLLSTGQPPAPVAVERREQPAGSKVVVEQWPGGVTLNVPPLGLRGVNLGLVVFGSLFATIGFVFDMMVFGAGNFPWQAWVASAGSGVFVAVGIAIAAYAIHNSRRRAGLAVADGELMILLTGFRKLERRWAASEVASILVGPSGMTVNDKPVLELQIIDAAGKKCGLLAGRNVPELEWIATLLRDALAESEPEPAPIGQASRLTE